MKNIRRLCAISAALLVSVLMTMLTSCSHTDSTITDKLEQFIANDVDFVSAGNLQRLLEVTESKAKSDGSVELSDYMSKLISSMPSDIRNGINDILEAEGFEWSSAVWGVRIGSSRIETLCVWSLKDEDDFIDYFTDKYHFRKGKLNGYNVLYDDSGCIALSDGYGFMATTDGEMLNPEKTVALIADWQNHAKNKRISKWKCDYLDSDDMCTALVNLDNIAKQMQQHFDEAEFYEQTRTDVQMLNAILPDMRKIIVGLQFNIKGLDATLKGRFFTSAGEAYLLKHLDGTFNAELLKYATNDDMAVIGLANATYLTSLLGHSISGFGSEIIARWLDNFNGSMMIGTGVKDTDIKNIIEAPTKSMHWIMAAECKPGKADDALNAFASLIPFADDAKVTKRSAGEVRFRVPTSYAENSALEPWEDGYYSPVYTDFVMKTDGDILLVSNAEIDPTPVSGFTPDMFKGKSMVGVIHLPKTSPLMRNINAQFGANLRLSLEKSQFEIKFSLDSKNKNLLEVLVNIAGPALN